MPIYTRTGDTGTTAIFGGRRVLKSDSRIEAYGSVDELTSFIGLLIAKTPLKSEQRQLTNIQKTLYRIMAFLATATINLKTGKDLLGGLETEVKEIERIIDKRTARLPKLIRFILPQGSEIISLFHVVRTVARRAERRVVFLKKGGSKKHDLIIRYLNRLSDLFFTMARSHAKGKDIIT